MNKITILFLCFLLTACATMRNDWERALSLDNSKAYEEFLSKHPESEYSAEARKRLEIVEQKRIENAWKDALAKNTFSGYLEFDKLYPENSHTWEVNGYLETKVLEGQINNIDGKKGFITMTTIDKTELVLVIEKVVEVRKDWKNDGRFEIIGGFEKLNPGNSVEVFYCSLPRGKFVPSIFYLLDFSFFH